MGTRTARLTKMPRAEQWADQICVELGKTVDSIVEVGRLLVKAKHDLVHGEWGRIFDEHLIPFSQRTADRFMAIAQHPVIGNSTHVSNLPASWGTLYELTKVPDPILRHALQDGLITPDMERKHVRALLPARESGREPAVASQRAHANLHRPSSELYFRLADVLSGFNDLERSEQFDFLAMLEQSVQQLRASLEQPESAVADSTMTQP